MVTVLRGASIEQSDRHHGLGLCPSLLKAEDDNTLPDPVVLTLGAMDVQDPTCCPEDLPRPLPEAWSRQSQGVGHIGAGNTHVFVACYGLCD